MLSDRVVTAVICLICLVWTANFTAGILNAAYHPSETINAIFMSLVGAALAVKARGGGGNGGGHNGDDSGGRRGK